MGSSTFLNESAATGSTPHSRTRGSFKLHVDPLLVITVASLLIFGLLMVYSSSWPIGIQNGDPGFVLNNQLRWAVVGVIALGVLTFVDYHRLAQFALPIMLITILLLIVVLFVNPNPNVPGRTLLKNSVQPSEMAKLAIIIYLSVWLVSKKDQLNKLTLGLLPLMTIVAITAAIIVVQPDLSAAATVVLLGITLFFLTGSDVRQIALLLLVIALVGLLVVNLSSTGRQRLADFQSGWRDPIEASYHVQRAFEAIVNGGIFGVGIGKGTTKFTGLPVPWTDSIFAVITEETGLLGAIFIVGAYLMFIWRGFVIAQHAPDMMGKLMAAGITCWIGLEAIINMGVLINLAPMAGNALPLVSAGGSSLVTTMVGIGILMSIGRLGSTSPAASDGRSFNAVVDLRGRDRRRSVPRRSRFTGAR